MVGGVLVVNGPAPIDVEETLEQLHQVTEVKELDTSGVDAGPLGQVHPIGWLVAGLLVVAAVFHLRETEWLIGNFALWHWIGLLVVLAVSLRPGPIKAVSRFLDGISDYVERGSNIFDHPWAAFVTGVGIVAFGGLLIGPLTSVGDWVFGVNIEPVGTSEFEVTSVSSLGWLRTLVAAVVVAAAFYALNRLLRSVLPSGEVSIRTGGLIGLAAFGLTFLILAVVSGWQDGVTVGLGIGLLVAAIALGPLWVIAWGIFIVIFFYVVTRYTARFVEADIIIGEVNSLGLNLFGLLALVGVGYGVKAGVNPRIDFWWADFSNRRKAWLDFILHGLLLVPFLWAALRLLQAYAKTNLGFERDFSGEGDGSWPAGWHIWETWAEASDAGQLPVGPLRAVILIGFLLFLFQVVSEMIKAGFTIIHREDLAELKQVDAPTRIE